MINFDEELKRFKPSIEVEDVEEMIYSQDLDDMGDVMVKLLGTAADAIPRAPRVMKPGNNVK